MALTLRLDKDLSIILERVTSLTGHTTASGSIKHMIIHYEPDQDLIAELRQKNNKLRSALSELTNALDEIEDRKKYISELVKEHL